MNLKIISKAIQNRFSSGYYPYWNIQFIDIDKTLISDSSLRYISRLIITGYTSGEIVEKDDISGFWKLNLK